jgi:hypothetical protein
VDDSSGRLPSISTHQTHTSFASLNTWLSARFRPHELSLLRPRYTRNKGWTNTTTIKTIKMMVRTIFQPRAWFGLYHTKEKQVFIVFAQILCHIKILSLA